MVGVQVFITEHLQEQKYDPWMLENDTVNNVT